MFERSASAPTRNRITGRVLTGILAVALAGYTLPPATAADSPPPPTAHASVAAISAPAAPTMLAPARTMTTTVYFSTSSARVTPATRTALTRFVRSLPKAAVVTGVQVRGYVQGSPTTRDKKALSHARAANVAAVLKALRLPGPYSLTAGGVAGNTLRARRAVVTVTYRLRIAQTISFTQPEGMTVGDTDMPITATSSTGLLVTLTSLTPAVCTVVARAAHVVTPGTCSLRATQAGTGYVLPAAPVTRSFSISAVPAVHRTVTYDVNGGTSLNPSSAVFTVGGTALTLPTPVFTGHVFAGWFTAATEGTLVGAAAASYSPDADITLYAQWTAAVYTVTFAGHGGTGAPASVDFTFGDPALSLPSPTLAHYTFDGWFTAASGGTLVGGATDDYTPGADITLHAQWSAELYQVTYDLNFSGSGTPDSVSYAYGYPLPLPSPTRPHYTFDGWYTDAVDGTRVGGSGDEYSATATTTLFAHWTGVTYTVTFNTNNGDALDPSSASFTYGSPAMTLPTPTRTNYTFDGWYTLANDGTHISSPYAPSANITLYAQWNPAEYTVTFDANGGAPLNPSSAQYTYGGAGVALPTPTRDGYTFDGWFDAAADGNLVTSPYSPSGSITLYAYWSPVATGFHVTISNYDAEPTTAYYCGTAAAQCSGTGVASALLPLFGQTILTVFPNTTVVPGATELNGGEIVITTTQNWYPFAGGGVSMDAHVFNGDSWIYTFHVAGDGYIYLGMI